MIPAAVIPELRRVQVVAGDHAVTMQIFGRVPDEHPVDLRFGDRSNAEAVRATTRGADALVIDDEEPGREHLEALDPGVRVIGKLGTGLDTIDGQAAQERGVDVVYLPGIGSSAHRRPRRVRCEVRDWRSFCGSPT